MKAVSSPSLSENQFDKCSNTEENILRDACYQNGGMGGGCVHDDNDEDDDGCETGLNLEDNQQAVVHASVLQKLKSTLYQLKGKSTTTNAAPIETASYRFGPLVWRSSKERRKTKHQRRDKCNSGDSGIQVELDNEDMMQGSDSIDAAASPTPYTMNVRRANSVKMQGSSSSVKARALKRNEIFERSNSTPIPNRTLSHPSGLDQLEKGIPYFCFIYL